MTRKILLSALLCVFFVGLTTAQQPGEISYNDESVLPAGKKGERIQSIIDTLNSDNPESIRRFMEEECSERFRKFAPIDEHIRVFRNMFRETGGMTFHSIRTYVPERKGETVVILKDKNFDSWRSFVVRFSDDENALGTHKTIITVGSVSQSNRFCQPRGFCYIISISRLNKGDETCLL